MSEKPDFISRLWLGTQEESKQRKGNMPEKEKRKRVSHYSKRDFECVDIIRACEPEWSHEIASAFRLIYRYRWSYEIASAFKYLYRYKLKKGSNSREDIKKAINFLKMHLEREDA